MFNYLLRHGCRMFLPFPLQFGHPNNTWGAGQLVGCHLVHSTEVDELLCESTRIKI